MKKGEKMSDEEKIKHSIALMGHPTSDKVRKQCGDIWRGKHPLTEFKKGNPAPTKGRKFPERMGINAPNWKGGMKAKWQRGNRKRRNEKYLAEGSHTLGEWELLKKQYGYKCSSCGKLEPKIKLTEDHIIPLSKGGSDFIENIQPLCKSCNSKKMTKIIKY